MANIKLADILATLEAKPEETFLAKLATDSTKVTTTTPVNTDAEKIAEATQIGKIMANSMWEELNKLAISPQQTDTPDPGMLVESPAVQLGRNISNSEITAKVQQIINQLKAGTEAGVPVIGQSGNIVEYPARGPVDKSAPIAIDQAHAQEDQILAGQTPKTAGDRILTALYNLYVKQ